MTGRRLLITGATGGLGIALVRQALAEGYAVRAIGRSPEAGARLAEMGAEFTPLDLSTDEDFPQPLMADCDSIIHAAALSASWGPYADFERANVHMTRKLLTAARSAPVSRFVFVSSPSIFADFRDRMNIGPEDTPAGPPLNHYAQTKLEAEQLVLSSAAPELSCCAIRPRALVGEGDKVILPRLAQLAMRKRIPLPGGGRALIELTDLRDAARAILLAEKHAEAISGQALNISGGQPVSVKVVAENLAECLGKHPQFVNIPLSIAREMATLMETIAKVTNSQTEPVLTRYTLATLGYSQTFDLSPAERLIGYIPQYDAFETLLQQARQMKASKATA